ncbi:conserved Plasmodium protein, unknown function [Plasmodium berghei]|uniref:Uncharacterized protein n=2 Tax=Plasmodium berghei TaxID=5821 RepID=A0A509AMH3_PLABA|nr:conserved Plasmodium protein, unknown function [Plasmodium berghei ANKA]CXI82590.1 conserved Plasmodium protein, unknown function [Plasmodium berghei]SCM25639.1 conserved Plasmodium protein, unknown function [Plasmodium berghei]SCO63858.1 conserved Plasmodium protein, unknown function [Plasmodium berghei]VUC57285.1 conserved Plasmodium protein, unknown function [Plasmodium berghei ANKA]|eukprot:XP_034423063.1 conserved Plasmodium protein, unknown function [Plasmodium berghei ANKA]
MEMRARTPKSIKGNKDYEHITSSQYYGSKKKTISSKKVNKNCDKKKTKINKKKNIQNDIEIRNNFVYNDQVVNKNIPNKIKIKKKIDKKIHNELLENILVENSENNKSYDDVIRNSCNNFQTIDNHISSIPRHLNHSKSGEQNNSLNNQDYKRGRRKTKQHKDNFFCYYDEIENEEREISSEKYGSDQGKKNKMNKSFILRKNEKKIKQNHDSISNKFNDFIKKENDIYDYNLDLFDFLSNFKTNEDNTENLNKLVLFILQEIDGKKVLANNNIQVGNKNNYISEGEYDRMKANKINKYFFNIKENIDIEHIINHDRKDIRNVFFFENININYNDKNVIISPFKSSLVIDNNATDIFSQKKKKKTANEKKNSINKKDQSINDMDIQNNPFKIIKIRISKYENLPMYININENNVKINFEIICFLYFLLICNCLSRNNTRNHEFDTHNSSFDLIDIFSNIDENSACYFSGEKNIFLSLCSPVIYLDFTININLVNFFEKFLQNCNIVNNNELSTYHQYKLPLNICQGEKNKIENLQELINMFLLKCRNIFNGCLLAISICSYLNTSIFSREFNKSRNFLFIYFVSQFMNSSYLFDIIEVGNVCKKAEWIKLNTTLEGISKNTVYDSNISQEDEYTYLLICLVGYEIIIYGISKYDYFIQLYYSIKDQNNIHTDDDNNNNKKYIENKLMQTKFKKLFSYKNDDIVNDFSYSIYIKNNQRYIKLAICCNNMKIKIINIFLKKNKNEYEINNFIQKTETTNMKFDNCNSSLPYLFPFKNIGNFELKKKKSFSNSSNESKTTYERNNNKLENTMSYFNNEYTEKSVKYNITKYSYYNVYTMEDILHIKHGIITLCSFYPCINSFILCISIKEGDVIVIDIRNNSELFYFKRKTETISHLKWNNNSCISFGQDKGCIIYLFENKYFLNIDKIWNNIIETICTHNCIISDNYFFTFDDGTIIKGKIKINPNKIKHHEIISWNIISNFSMDPQIILNISSTKSNKISTPSLTLLYEYLCGLQHILKTGIKITKSENYDPSMNRKVVALVPKTISFSYTDNGYMIAYGNTCGLIHIFFGKTDTPPVI